MSQIMRITTVGLPPQERTILGVAASLLGAFDLDVRLLGEADPDANLAVVNGDSVEGLQYLAAASAPLKIVITDQERNGGGQFFLARPVRVQGLKDAIYDLWNSHQGLLQGKPSASAAAAAPVTGTKGAESLFGAMLLARQAQQIVEFKDAHHHSVLLDGVNGFFYTELQGKTLEAMAGEQGNGTPLSSAAAQARIRGQGGYPFADLVWMAAWFGAKGVSDGEALDVPVRLRTFPRLPKHFLRPEYVRVAAMLTKTPLSPQQLSQTSGVALERVVNFCRIARVLGILETLPGAPPAAGRGIGGGLLAKLAKRLSLGAGTKG